MKIEIDWELWGILAAALVITIAVASLTPVWSSEKQEFTETSVLGELVADLDEQPELADPCGLSSVDCE